MINIKILVTNKCNYNCKFCHDEFQSREARDERFDSEKLRSVIGRHINSYAGEKLSFKFSGGEPTLNWDSLMKLLDISLLYDAVKRTLISNLSRLTEPQMDLLVGKGVNEIRVNIPSFYPTDYCDLTGGNDIDRTNDFKRTLKSMQYLKNAGCDIRVNSVLTNLWTEEDIYTQLSKMISKAKELGFIDEINFIADYYAENKDFIYRKAADYLKSMDKSWTFRRNRIYCGKSDNLKVAVSRCLDRENNEKDDTEIYIIPNGKILEDWVLKREKV